MDKLLEDDEFNRRIIPLKGCLEWIGNRDNSSYGIDGQHKTYRYAWELFYNQKVPKYHCNPACVNPLRLENLSRAGHKLKPAKGVTNNKPFIRDKSLRNLRRKYLIDDASCITNELDILCRRYNLGMFNKVCNPI